MASSYSPLLRLELIGSGEQASLWGENTVLNPDWTPPEP